ncbi:hypothetical protein ABI59_06790 [Acidobacteria bacterium Mor1]|nr:hypothetical protein ABI59_06790 [Acidobacteria bacterium Mor1]
MRFNWALLIVAALVLLWVRTAVFTVDETELAIVTRFGKPAEEASGPGLHFKAPWPVDRVMRLDSRLLVFDNEPMEFLTLDKKNVLVDTFLCWRVADPLHFARTVKTRSQAEARLLDVSQAKLGAAVGSEPMEGFINVEPGKVRLRDLAARVAREVDEVARKDFGLEVVDLQINGFNLPAQNRASVIDRMRAERARIATKYRSEGEEEALKIEAEAAKEREETLATARAEAEVIRGEGEAAALAELGEAYAKDPEFYRFLRTLESYDKIIDDQTTIFLESDSRLMKVLSGK